jgi:hypothetical protein
MARRRRGRDGAADTVVRVDVAVRDASGSDHAAIGSIAHEGDSSTDDLYLEFIRANGSLRVGVSEDGAIVGFAGVIDRGDGVTMLTDLFVAARCRGHRVGTILLDDVLAGSGERMTFSSQHPAALAAYLRAGMTPSWRLLYLRGSTGAHGAGRSDRRSPGGSWRGGRPELAAYFVGRGGTVIDNAIVIDDGALIEIARFQDRRGAAAFDELLASLPNGSTVTCCSPEDSPVAQRALGRGFEIVDHDIFCATPGVTLPVDLHCLNPGLV